MSTEQAFRPSCPHCGAFTVNHADGCWRCSRCGAEGDIGQHRAEAHGMTEQALGTDDDLPPVALVGREVKAVVVGRRRMPPPTEDE